MKVEVNFEKRYVLGTVAAVLVVLGAFFVVANYPYDSIPNPGHGADEIQVDLSGVEKNLQEAVNSDLCRSDGTNCAGGSLATTVHDSGLFELKSKTSWTAQGDIEYQYTLGGDNERHIFVRLVEPWRVDDVYSVRVMATPDNALGTWGSFECSGTTQSYPNARGIQLDCGVSTDGWTAPGNGGPHDVRIVVETLG